MSEKFFVTFYFTSGEKKEIVYSKEKFVEMYAILGKSWPECRIATDRFGINFAHVTHYEVNEKK